MFGSDYPFYSSSALPCGDVDQNERVIIVQVFLNLKILDLYNEPEY